MCKLQFRLPSGIFFGGWVAPGSSERISGTYISSPSPAFATSLLEKKGLCIWGNRNLQMPLEALAHTPPPPPRSHDRLSSCPSILQLSNLSTESCCIFYAAHHWASDADFHSYGRQKWRRQIASSSSLQLWNPFQNCSLAGLRDFPGLDGI